MHDNAPIHSTENVHAWFRKNLLRGNWSRGRGPKMGRVETKIERSFLGSDLAHASSPLLRAKAALLRLAAVTGDRRKKSYILLYR
jgi:hypothetical protein